jgi:hypothetical protein
MNKQVYKIPFMCGVSNERMRVQDYRNDDIIQMKCNCGHIEYTNLEAFKESEYWCSYTAYGDVNPIEHGGQWVKKVSVNDYDIITLEYDESSDTLIYGTVLLDITDSWIDMKDVLSYSDLGGSSPSELYALAIVDYYGIVNCGGTIDNYDLDEIDQLKAMLKEAYNILV